MAAIEVANKGSLSGEELYSQFLAGDEGAFTRVVEIYESGISTFIFDMVNDYHEARHLTIETFAMLAAGGNKLSRSKNSLKVCLFAIASSLASNRKNLKIN